MRNFSFLLFLPFLLAASPGKWPIERLKSETPAYRILDASKPVHSIVYEGEKIGGEATEVFAFYATPKTLGKDGAEKPFPGIVLIHGGGGTAFADWVHMWAERGYAAIAMDLGGRRPPEPTFGEDGNIESYHRHKREIRVPLEKGGVADSHNEKFASIETETREDDWPFHAVANVMRAHTLLRSFPEVDAERTAVTGISWGGYTTCLVASLDDRFKAAVPVYGCGFLHEGESVQKKSVDRLGAYREKWVTAYDPSSHLGKCTVPTLWVNGTHDIHYPLDSYAKSYRLVKGPRTIRVEPRMGHSHPAGWVPKEIRIFIDSILKNEKPLPEIKSVQTSEEGSVSVTWNSATEIEKAKLHFTTDTGPRSKREWQSLPAKLDSNSAMAMGLPENANTWFITLTDKRGAMVSSEVFFR